MSSVELNPVPVLSTSAPRHFEGILRTVQLADKLLTLALLPVAAPVIAISAFAVAVLSRRSPFVAHLRIGQFGVPFWMVKLRTMWTQAPAAAGPHRLIERILDDFVPDKQTGPDPRVTSRFARFCRRSSIDELPQLLHVLLGRMSLVGPRPVTRAELDRYYGSDAETVLQLKPGLAGLWQTMGRNRLNYHQRRRLDLLLVRRFSLRLYFAILLRAVPQVLSGRDAW